MSPSSSNGARPIRDGADVKDRLCAIAAMPARHSLSPALYTAGFAQCGLNWEYLVREVDVDGFTRLVDEVAALPQWAGLSVSMPHKSRLVELVQGRGTVDPIALTLHAANTLARGEDGTLHAYNTDVEGFCRALRYRGVGLVESVIIVGNGATAKSALLAVNQMGATQVIFVARDPAKAQSLAVLAKDWGMDADVAHIGQRTSNADILISTIPATGMNGHADRYAQIASAVFDVSYDPWPTLLTQQAAECGAIVLSGLDLLVHQAVVQFSILTGCQVSPETLYDAGQRELASR